MRGRGVGGDQEGRVQGLQVDLLQLQSEGRLKQGAAKEEKCSSL